MSCPIAELARPGPKARRASSKVKGAVCAPLERKSIVVQKNVLTVCMRATLEETLYEEPGLNELSVEEFVMIGQLLFCVHTRSRWHDAARYVVEPRLDGSGEDATVDGLLPPDVKMKREHRSQDVPPPSPDGAGARSFCIQGGDMG